jgi:hypothetical protein
MGLFDRLLGGVSKVGAFSSKPARQDKPAAKKDDNTFFLDPDASSTLGNVDYMRRSNKIRRTFPGNADNPGVKEMVQEVDSMQARLEKVSSGLPNAPVSEDTTSLTGGVPKPVKKTFAEKISAAELSQRLKGAAVGGVNVPGAPATTRRAAPADQPKISQQAAKPGAIDAYKDMAKDLTS